MKTVNALTIRQSLGRILEDLDRDGEPVLVEKGRRPRAALISLSDFRERFVDRAAADERRRIVGEIRAFARLPRRQRADGRPAAEILRDLRGPLGPAR